MDHIEKISLGDLEDLLLRCAEIRPIFIIGSPGIGKTAVVRKFCHDVGLELQELTGTQLLPEDVKGVPRLSEDFAEFLPLKEIAKPYKYCLFLDEMNASSQDVQKAFYSLLLDKKIGNYQMPKGSIVIAAGNFSTDKAITRKMPSTLINRVRFVSVGVKSSEWLKWGYGENLHEYALSYIEDRPTHLFELPPADERPFSTPRSWHMLSDTLKCYKKEELNPLIVHSTAQGCINPEHAKQFSTYVKNYQRRHEIHKILKGELRWPPKEERDTLYFLAQSFKDILLKELPENKPRGGGSFDLTFNAKTRLKELAHINLEYAQLVISEERDGSTLKSWFLAEVARELPNLAMRKENQRKKEKENAKKKKSR